METVSLDIMQPLRDAGALFASGECEQALKDVIAIWNGLPENKFAVPNAYMILEYAVEMTLRLGRLDEARTWAEHGLAFREKRHDLGEAEFLLAKVAYARGDLDVARELLVTASKRSGGRMLRGEDAKYRALIRNAHRA